MECSTTLKLLIPDDPCCYSPNRSISPLLIADNIWYSVAPWLGWDIRNIQVVRLIPFRIKQFTRTPRRVRSMNRNQSFPRKCLTVSPWWVFDDERCLKWIPELGLISVWCLVFWRLATRRRLIGLGSASFRDSNFNTNCRFIKYNHLWEFRMGKLMEKLLRSWLSWNTL